MWILIFLGLNCILQGNSLFSAVSLIRLFNSISFIGPIYFFTILPLLLIKNFSTQPDLIRKYNNIMQNLQIARKNLTGLVNARETFQLEIAQNAVPWRIIVPPIVEPVPSVPKIPQ